MSKMPPDGLFPDLFTNFMRSWYDPGQMQRLFNTLYEPILPNGTFAGVVINENNSTNPTVERQVVSQYSYGRQLDALINAVDVLIKELPVAPKDKDDTTKLKALQAMKLQIDDLKTQVRKSQADRVIDELGKLSKEELARCAEVVAQLQGGRGS
jgi:hypothetical protein